MTLFCLCGAPMRYIFVIDDGGGLARSVDNQIATISPRPDAGAAGCSDDECPYNTVVFITDDDDVTL